MKKLIVFVTCLLAATTSLWAYDFSAQCITGQTLYYNINADGTTVSLTSELSSSPYYTTFPEGDVEIPSTVTHDQVTYTVTTIGQYALRNCSGIFSVVIPNTVTTIEKYAFYYCNSLSSVVLSNSLTTIKEYAFGLCRSLPSITLPNSLETIEQFAFSDGGLYSITIPASVTSIGMGAFRGIYNLANVVVEEGNTTYKSIDGALYNADATRLILCPGARSGSFTIPNTVQIVSTYAFYGCMELTTVTIPNSVVSFEGYTFHNCKKLTSIVIPNSVIRMGSQEFYNCSELVSVELPSSITAIGSSMFEYCRKLSSITIPSTVTVIYEQAFMNCSELTSIEIPATVTEIGAAAFKDCENLATITFLGAPSSIGKNAFANTAWYNGLPDGLVYTNGWCLGYKGDSPTGAISIQAGTVGIAKNAFENCTGITSVAFPNTLTSMGQFAFRGCTGLTSLSLPNLHTIEYRAFYGCTGLTEVTFPENATIIGEAMFGGCTNLATLTLPNTITRIDGSAFQGCSSLATFTIPNSVTFLGYGAFTDTDWWTNQSDGIVYKDGWCLGYKGNKPAGALVIQDETKNIAYNAFSACRELTSVTIPNTVTTLLSQVFYNCSGITSIILPETLTEIGSYAFFGCTALTTFSIPASVTTIGGNAFKNTGWYNNQSDGILYKDGWCLGYKGSVPTDTLSIQEGTKYVAATSFNTNCQDVVAVVLPSSLIGLGQYAFANDLFTSLTSHALVPPTIDTTFNTAYQTATVYVHTSSLQAYKNDTYWQRFTILPISYTITATSADENMGSVSGGGVYNEDAEVELTVTPNDGYRFVQWNDGNKENPRTITVTADAEYTATFVAVYTLTVDVNDEAMGSVEIADEAEVYAENTEVTLTATPATGYHFVQWSDENTDNPRTITMTENTTLTATFAVNTYSLLVDVNDEAMGSVEIADEAETYEHGTEVVLTATPAENYKFVKWSDENTDNPRTITMTENTTLTAIFADNSEGPDAIAEAQVGNARVFAGEKRIIVKNAAEAMVEVYDVTGRTIVKAQRVADTAIFAVPQTGMYIVRVANAAIKVFVR